MTVTEGVNVGMEELIGRLKEIQERLNGLLERL
jgi:hypothetical protein